MSRNFEGRFIVPWGGITEKNVKNIFAEITKKIVDSIAEYVAEYETELISDNEEIQKGGTAFYYIYISLDKEKMRAYAKDYLTLFNDEKERVKAKIGLCIRVWWDRDLKDEVQVILAGGLEEQFWTPPKRYVIDWSRDSTKELMELFKKLYRALGGKNPWMGIFDYSIGQKSQVKTGKELGLE